MNKPGNGWRHLGGAVYENGSLRIHLGGMMCRLSDGSFVYGQNYPEYTLLHRMVAINGGNRKRGLMAWANTKQIR